LFLTLLYLIIFWVPVMYVLDMLWVLGVCDMSLSMLCAFLNTHTMKGYECKTCLGITQFVLENMNGAKARLGERIAAVPLYWLHSISWVDLTFSHCWVMGHCGLDVVAFSQFSSSLNCSSGSSSSSSLEKWFFIMF
jgi:hypothetical protein